MEFIRADRERAARILSDRLVLELIHGKKVLWAVPGGSNISLSALALEMTKEKTPLEIANLSVILTDERFGPVGHKDSNWRQLEEAGFDLRSVKGSPVLKGLSLEETVRWYESEWKRLSEDADVVIGQFGIGSDSHIAGALPGSPAILSKRLVEAYETPQYTRATLTLKAIREMDAAYAFVFGESKKHVVESLRRDDLDAREKPAAVLKEIEDSFLVSDQIE